MQHSDQPSLELAKARAAIGEMRDAKTLDALEEAWKEFLGRLERVWNKGARVRNGTDGKGNLRVSEKLTRCFLISSTLAVQTNTRLMKLLAERLLA